jgi:DNA polymerase lambda
LLLQVRELAQQINPGLEVVTCGSYRRGKLTCGDVDILVTHSDGRSHRGVLPKLIQEGRESGFLTDDLTIHNDQNGGGKYLGVCRLPGQDRKYRRIDIYVTPYAEFPCMLLHFTGSGHFNRSIRSKADKLGMSLSEHSLNIGVIRKVSLSIGCITAGKIGL